MRKKISIVLIAIISLTLLYGCSDNILLKINWDIYLPKPKNVENIYNFDYREGDDFEIWKYSDSKTETIKENEFFTIITSDNIEKVKSSISEYYNDLAYDENLQDKFNEKFSMEDTIIKGNYYSLIIDEEEHPGCYLLMLLDGNSNMLYYFNHIR